MNYLAHSVLPLPHQGLQIGGLIGDFVKGPLSLPGQALNSSASEACNTPSLPDDLLWGVHLHRQIDLFADQHPAFLRSRSRVSTGRRRFSGVLVDMFYDHLLAAHWERFAVESFHRADAGWDGMGAAAGAKVAVKSDRTLPTLNEYTDQLYRAVAARAVHLPKDFLHRFTYIRQDDWLAGYAQLDGTASAIDGIARRFNTQGKTKRMDLAAGLQGGGEELRQNYAAFLTDFAEFWVDANRFVQEFLRRNALA